MSLFVLSSVLSCLIAAVAGAGTCQQAMENALLLPEPNQTSYPCCSGTNSSCIEIPLQDSCTQPFFNDARCINFGNVTACGTNTFDGPGCGVYSGTPGPYGVTVIAGTPVFNLSVVQTAIFDNWPSLSYDDALSLCCDPTSAACITRSDGNLVDNPCQNEEYELMCSGDALHGLCSVFAPKPADDFTELGQFLLVNVDPAAKPASSSSSSSAGATGTSSPTAAVASHKAGFPAWAGAVIAVAAIVVIGTTVSVVLCLRGRRARHMGAPPVPDLMAAARVDPFQTPAVYQPFQPPMSMPAPMPPMSTGAGSSAMSDYRPVSVAPPSAVGSDVKSHKSAYVANEGPSAEPAAPPYAP